MVLLTDTHQPVSRAIARSILGIGVFVAVVLLVSGCHREQIAVYDAPKDVAPPAPPASPHAGATGDLSEDLPPRPGLRWKALPPGWTSKGAAGMRVANFSIAGPQDTGSADLAVIPLPGSGGSDVDLVNLWRGQLGLSPITDAELPLHTDATTVGAQPVKLFSIVGAGSADQSAAGSQILVAALRREGFTWFFKLAGESGTVAANRESLKAFLENLEFTAPETSAAASVSPPSPSPTEPGTETSGPKARWQVPENWRSVSPPPMVHSKWTVTGAGAAADITVSVFPGTAGGLVPNLNRWRSQVGLKPAPDQELNALLDNFDVLGGKATLADFSGSSPESGNPLRLVAVVVRRDAFSWFYKILGPPENVEAQRAAFLKFVQTAEYSPRS